ncbi:MAG TPA: hypothetical protein VHD36_03800 [Pirellulales bacterium]|nr:hypothetical protein [Pirellulales bacterium]
MKFGTRTLLLGTAFVAVSLGFCVATVRTIERHTLIVTYGIELAYYAVFSSSLWLPLAFFVYAVGSRRLTARMVACFTSAEFLAFCAVWYFLSHAA